MLAHSGVWVALLSIGLTVLSMWPGSAHAQEGVAVVPVTIDGQAPDPAVVTSLETALDDGERWVMKSAEVRATLTTSQSLGADDAKVQKLASDMQKGVDAYYEDRMDEAEKLLDESIRNALSQPLLLVFSPRLAEQTKDAMLVLPRVYLASARFDEAADVTRRLVEVFPTYIPSRKQYRPDVVQMVEESRVQHTSLGKRLILRGGTGESCALNMNGDEVLLEGEREIPVSTATYAIMMKCGDTEAGPWLVSMKAVEQELPVSSVVAGALESMTEAPSLTLPSDREPQHDTAAALQTVLGTESVFWVGNGGDGILIARYQDGALTRATVDAEPNEVGTLIPEMLIALDRGEPIGEVAVDTGDGWERLEQRTYIAEYIVMGVGGATLITGAVFLGLAASQADVVRECQDPGACSAGVAQDNADIYAGDLFAGQLMTGIGSVVLATGATIFLVRYLTAPDAMSDSGDYADGFGVSPTAHGAMATWRLTW